MNSPEPIDCRWRPLRAGLVDLFYYDVEEFHFHHGSLLLRGNNGTGKSKVLALTVPFLLDGELAAHRVEPDGDRAKRMEWNLLLGGKHPHPERLGYTWLEFGRLTPDGTACYTTLGCGLKAASGRGIVRHWFFITSQRVGDELPLVTPTGAPVTRDRLRETIGECGLVYDRASDYRRGVDDALFGLGPRYDALVNLLIQLRQPQLSKRPDERLLSSALTQALPPVDENLVTGAAEAFRSLDDEREALVGLRETKRAADDFLTGYRRYARTAAKRMAAGPRRAQGAYERLGRELGEAERSFVQAEQDLASAGQRLETLESGRQRLAVQQAALRESPEARAAENLRREARDAERLATFAERQRDAHTLATEDSEKAAQRLDRARADLDSTARTVAIHRASASEAATDARIEHRHSTEIDPATEAATESGLATARTVAEEAEELATWRDRSIRTLNGMLAEVSRAVTRLRQARGLLETVTTELGEADGRLAQSRRDVAATGARLVADLRTFLTGAEELRLPDPETVLAALELWVETLDGDNPARIAVTEAYRSAAEALTRERAAVDAAAMAERARRDDLCAEIERLRAGGQGTPPAPRTRATGAREHRPGAPLWRLVDFSPEVCEADRAGIEAALEASGILDAWVCPDGAVLDTTTHDLLLRSGPRVTPSLAGPLLPAIDPLDELASQVDESVVDRILGSIGLVAGQVDHGAPGVHIDAQGRFRLEVLTGRWGKPRAEYIGEGAREAARRARVAELSEEVDLVDAGLETLAREAAEVGERVRRLNAEHDTTPGDIALREAHAAERGEAANRARVAEARDRAEEKVNQAVVDERASVEAAAEFATDVDLPTDPGALAGVAQALGAYRVAVASLWPAVRAWRMAANAVAEAEPDLLDRQVLVAEAAERLAEAEQEAMGAAERHRTLAATVGAAVADLEARLVAIDQELRHHDREIKKDRLAERKAVEDRGRAEGRRDALNTEVREAAGRRDETVDAFRSFAGTGLLALACPELEIPDPGQPWAATPAVALGRATDRLLEAVDDSDRRWELAQQSVSNGFKQLAEGLSRHGHQAAMTARDGHLLVDVVFQGRTQPVAGLATALETEVAERQRILSAREREVLETHLVNEVAGTIQELIVAAENQVARMNRELADRPTSTGMRLRLVWRASKTAPEGLADLRGRLLRQSSDAWNDEDRRRVGAFLSEQIAAERVRDDAGTWYEQLTSALDYRAWHEFAIQRHADGQWRPAAGPASGGERVLAASVPLFAAASSYYASAGNPNAPRLIALDEAFAGVDDDSRAKCLGLLARFDLDVVMTSEREWGCYPEVPGLAIAQLARVDGIDAVLVTPWRWDGRTRHRVPSPRAGEPDRIPG